ncbi:hypothetical protein CCHL11_10051, partial [Colletotrichum chlorophyti]
CHYYTVFLITRAFRPAGFIYSGFNVTGFFLGLPYSSDVGELRIRASFDLHPLPRPLVFNLGFQRLNRSLAESPLAIPLIPCLLDLPKKQALRTAVLRAGQGNQLWHKAKASVMMTPSSLSPVLQYIATPYSDQLYRL